MRSLVGQPRRVLAEGSRAWFLGLARKEELEASSLQRRSPRDHVPSSLWRAVEVRSRARMWVLFL